MFEDYIKLLNERKKINKKVDKRYKKLIISIIICALGFLTPRIIAQSPLLINIIKIIDGLYMALFKTNKVITPLSYIGMAFFGSIFTVVNSIRLFIQKNKLRNVELEEKEKLLELENMVNELTNENKKVKEEAIELGNGKKKFLKELKQTLEEKVDIIKNGNPNETLDNNQEKENNPKKIK